MARQKGWKLGQAAFDRLLATLDSDRDLAGEKYQSIRARLTRLFEWRGCAWPEALADDAIDRVARRLEEGEQIRASDPAVYFYGVARNVLKEYWTEQQRERAARIAGFRPLQGSVQDLEDIEFRERLDCLEQCLAKLPPHSLDLITRYYRSEKRGKIDERIQMAGELAISAGTLRIRAHRIRRVLELCVQECLKQRAERRSNG